MYRILSSIFVLLSVTFLVVGADFHVSLYDGLQQFRVSVPPAPGQRSMTLSASRNETVGLQVVLFNPSDREMSGIKVIVENMPGITSRVDAAGAIHVYPTSNNPTSVRQFDLLRPAGRETVEAQSFRPYWIDFTVAENATPGLRKGTITFKYGGTTQSVSVQINVSHAILPVTPTLSLAFAFGRNLVEEFYGRTLTGQELFRCYDTMLAHHLSPVPMWNDADNFYQEEVLRHCADRGMNVFFVGVSGSSTEERQANLAIATSRINLLRGLNLSDKIYMWSPQYDEVLFGESTKDPEVLAARIGRMRASYELFHETHPVFKRHATVKNPDPRLDDFVDRYIILASDIQPEYTEQDAWWYTTGQTSWRTSPDFRLDFPPMVARYCFLALWRVGGSGYLYWATQREWAGNKGLRESERVEDGWQVRYVSASNGNMVESCGAGNLFYPGGEDNIMLPSIRVKRLRDGVNDYEHLVQLRAASELLAARQPAGWVELLQEANALMNFSPNLIAPSQSGYLNWHDQRNAARSLLEQNKTGDFFAFRTRLVNCLDRICVAINDIGPFDNVYPGRKRQ